MASPPLQRTHWGIVVHDPGQDRPVYALNADHHFVPASNTKLVVTAVALGRLGPEYRYTTTLEALAGVNDTTAARLVLVGSGDPTLSARFYPDEFAPLDSLAAMVVSAGIRTAGELIIDASRLRDEPIHSTWEIGDLPFTYATAVGAFAIGEGTFALERRPGPGVGEPASLRVLGGVELQPIAAHVRTDTARARPSLDVEYIGRRDTVFVSGRVALGAAPDTVRYAVIDPVGYAARALAASLRRHGVTVDSVRVVRDTAEAALLRGVDAEARAVARLVSPPLTRIVAAILQPSQNWIAEQLLKTLGAEARRTGTWINGLEEERRYLIDVVGIDSLAFSLRDASGLSAQNLLTPLATVRLLEHARTATWGDHYRKGLAAPGMRGSTLSARLRALDARVQAKTGSIANVNSLSGYVITDSGRQLTFSILTNGSGLPSAPVRQAIDAIVEAVARRGGWS